MVNGIRISTTARHTGLLPLATIARVPVSAQQLLPTSTPKATIIRFYAPMMEQSVTQLLKVIDQKTKEESNCVVLLKSSAGGSVFAGQSISDAVITHHFAKIDPIASEPLMDLDRLASPEYRRLFWFHGGEIYA
jgi:hypothetical protein